MTLQEAIDTGLPFKRPNYQGLIQVDKETGALFWAEHTDSDVQGEPVSISVEALNAVDWINSAFTSNQQIKEDNLDLLNQIDILHGKVDALHDELEILRSVNATLSSMNEKIRVLDERLQKSEIAFENHPISGAV